MNKHDALVFISVVVSVALVVVSIIGAVAADSIAKSVYDQHNTTDRTIIETRGK